MVRRARRAFVINLLVVIGIATAEAQTPLTGIDLSMPDEGAVLYRRLPNAPLTLLDGRQVRLADLWTERPLLLVFVFARCTGICIPLCLSVREATEIVGGAGEEYEVVVVSFDPRETPAVMAQFLQRAGLPPQKGWQFATGEPRTLQQLVEATGFWFQRVEDTDQYDHPGMVIAVKEGRIVRVHVGANFSPATLRSFLRELRGERVLSYPLPDAKLAFRCYRYDPRTGETRVDWGMLALWLPSLLGFSSASLLFTLTRRRYSR